MIKRDMVLPVVLRVVRFGGDPSAGERSTEGTVAQAFVAERIFFPG
jgi:hypothetical protein